MAVYKIDRSRNISFMGKFKFNYEVVFGNTSEIAGGSNSGQTNFTTGSYIRFEYGDIFTGSCAVVNRDPEQNESNKPLYLNGDGGISFFGPNLFDEINKTASVKFSFNLIAKEFGQTVKDSFILFSVPYDPNSQEVVRVTGTIEGTMYFGMPMNEFVGIDEYYPSENYFLPSASNCGDDEYWKPKNLDKNTVRQWPKYTTLNWFELSDTTKKSVMGIYIQHTNSKGQKQVFSKTYYGNTSVFPTDYTVRKYCNSFVGTVANSGYVSVSSNVPFSALEERVFASTPYAYIDTENFDVKAHPDAFPGDPNPKSFARFTILTEASRKASFESVVKQWKDNYSEKLTAYIVGFESIGKTFFYKRKEYPFPTFQKVETTNGIISGSQTYRFYKIEEMIAHDNRTGSVSPKPGSILRFDNRQRWIHAVIDNNLSKEKFDTTEMPTDHYDYPDKWVQIDGCTNINEINQILTLDGYELTSNPVPIPLRGWKFNAMSLYQDPNYLMMGTGNLRNYSGTAQNPYFYGAENLSGYRYLNIQVRSKNGENHSSNFEITSTSKGPSIEGNTQTNEDIKTWSVSTKSKSFENVIIDLCNPNNKIDFVDNQDSPYPRLNTYTTSRPQESDVLGFLAQSNKPKDDFLIVKPSLTSSSKEWIDQTIKQRIINSGYIYLTDKTSEVVDYFEVNTRKFPSTGGTNIIYGKPRVYNGRIKLAKYWNGLEGVNSQNPDYRKTLYLYIPQNDITKNKTIEDFIKKDKNGNYPDEYQIYDYDPGIPDVSDNITKLTADFIDGSSVIFVNPIAAYENNIIVPYDGILLENSITKVSKKYQIIEYINDTSNSGKTFLRVNFETFDPNLKFNLSTTNIKFCFYNRESDDSFRTVFVKFKSINKFGNQYVATLEYAKLAINDVPDYDGIPFQTNLQYNYFSTNAPVISLVPPKLVEFTFPVDTEIRTNIATNVVSDNEVNAIDDFPEDEVTNGPYYGISRIKKIELISDALELGEIKLVRNNSLSNFVYSGNNNTFESQTKFKPSTTLETSYYTRRFWQQNTDARDEEEGDIDWQITKGSVTGEDQIIFSPKSISDLCDSINKKDSYVAPRWLNSSNAYSSIYRHPGWKAQKVPKRETVDPITGQTITTYNLDPEYLNSETGYATWVYGGGILAVPSGKNSGSGTTYILAIDVNFNQLQNILAQTIFHRINADFPPGKPDLFGNTSLRNDDGTIQESTLHLRGGFIARGPGYGLILPPQKSTTENLRKANLIEVPSRFNVGSSESDAKGYFETGSIYGKNKLDHYIELEKSTKFPTPSDFRSSTRNMSQAKRERASYKGGKQTVATNLSACESGFEKSIVIAYTVPTTKPGEENQTAIIQTDSFFNNQYEKFSVGFNNITGIGVTVKGEFPFLLSSEIHLNQNFRINTFLLTERNSSKTATNSHYYDSLIASNTDMRNKLSWYPYIDGQAKKDANFSTLSKAFTGTKYNSYCISDQAPQLFNVGYADPGAIVFRSISLSTTNIQAPITDKTIFIDGIAPTYISDFRLIDQISSSGTAYSSFPTVTQISSREYIVAYSLNESPRKINFKIISNYQAQAKNTLFDLDALTGNTLSDKYNIYGLTSDYDPKLGLHRSVFWCNGGIYFFEYGISSSNLGSNRTDKLHLIKGKLDENLVTELKNRNNIVLYYDSNSELNAEVPKQKPAIVSCKKQEYDGKVLVAYDTGKCNIEVVLFSPYFKVTGIRKFDIECVNTVDTTSQDLKPIADIQASPLSGQSALFVNFLSTNSYDPGGSTLSYAWNFGDETQSTEENPVHTFVNNTTSPILFKVSLIVTNSNGVSSDPATIIITVNPAPVNNLIPQAKFAATPTSGSVSLTVTFTDQSTPANDGSFIQLYEWDFGDGNTSIKFDNLSFTYDYTRAGSFTPTLMVKDNLARISSTFIGPTINVDGTLNNPPSPGFKSAQTSYSPTLKIQFTDISSDDEGPLVAWHWDFGDNQTSDVQNPEHIYADPGKYLVILTVTDSGGLQASGSKEITVLPPGNNPPISNFTYSQQNRKLVIDFADTSTDSDGVISSWNWNFGDNSFDTIQNPSHSYLSAGTYQVSLSVTDNGGKTNTITKNVIVAPLINLAPVISNITGTQTSFKPLVGKFTETSLDPDGYISKWEWNFGDGQTFSTTDSTLKNPTHTYLFPGVYTVSLTVTDDGLSDGTNKKTATSSIQFTITPPPANQPPVALFTVDTNNVFAPIVINFTDASTDADGRIVSWLWEFETGRSVFYNAQTYQKTVSYTFNKSGTYPVKLTVRDDGNLSSTYILDIVIKNNFPVPILSASPNPVLSQTLVSFFGNNSYDLDGSISKYAWDFGDGTVISQGTTLESHTYSKPGTYRASLTVTDNIGDSSTANLLITVTNRNPVARITYTSLNVKAPGNLTFNGDTSSDPDGIISTYNWTVSNGLSATTPNATFNFTTEGIYTVALLVADDSGGTNSTSVIVNVTPPDNILPIAVLSVDKNSGIANDTFVFNTSSSYDPDGTIILYQLEFGDGTSTQFVRPAPIPHVYKSVGIFTAKLSVFDNRNGLSIETANSVQIITINNQPPVASFTFGPNNAFTFDLITFTDTSTDPDNSIVKWVWDYGDTTTFTTSDPAQKSPQKSYNKGNKDYTVSLTVYDNLGLFNTVSQLVRINNRKPFAVISTNKTVTNNTIVGIAPFTVIFDSNSYDLDGTVVNYEWYLNGISGTPITTKSFTYTFTNFRFTPYVVTLRVQDDDGTWSDSVFIGVKVNAPNLPPVAVIGVNPPTRTRLAPVTVDFSGAGSYDPDNVGGPLIYSWDFGNGSTSDLVSGSTTYSQPGTYKVSLTVTDNLAATNTATIDYIVLNNKPVALIDTVPSGVSQVQVNSSVEFTSSGSYDPDSTQFINGYKWLVDGVNQNSNTPSISTSFSTTGNHTVTLSVFDNLGLESDPVSKSIFVLSTPPPPINKNPIAILGNEPSVTGYIELKIGDTFTFDGTNSYDPEDATNITYEWSINNVKTGYDSTFINQFNNIGTFTISLVVFDSQKLSSTPATNLNKRYTVDVNVSAANPLANKLFSTGYGYYGAIASGDNLSRFGFQLVDDTKQYTIISAGGNHTLVVDADGKLYASGSNTNGQLGFASNITQLNSLTLVPLLSNYKVVEVSAGDWCSAIIVEDISINKRILLGCGDNSNGIFGQSLPKTNIFTFQPILEKPITNNGVSYLSSNNLSKVSCNKYILAFIHNKQVWVSGLHYYINKSGITDTGFIPINIDPNPDINPANINYLNPFKLQVGFSNIGYVCGIAYDIDSQIVWFTGKTTLRGFGYAYDISSDGGEISIISASQDQFDRSIIFYGFDVGEIPQFWGVSQVASNTYPGEFFVKISLGRAPFFALSQNHLFVFGDNMFGSLGLPEGQTRTIESNLQNNLPPYFLSTNDSVIGAYDIAAGGVHSVLLASDVKPSGQSFTIIRPNGYPIVTDLAVYPITEIAQ